MTRDEQLRYSRHMIMPEVGAEGQRRLNAARVLCIGAGGLGSPAAIYLAAAGIGKQKVKEEKDGGDDQMEKVKDGCGRKAKGT